jgi:hypothetical protein
VHVLEAAGFKIKRNDPSEKVIIAKRGLKLNEWNSVAGIYYKLNTNSTDIYIKAEITQDITGGWTDHRAKTIGDLVCDYFKDCTAGYIISAQPLKKAN